MAALSVTPVLSKRTATILSVALPLASVIGRKLYSAVHAEVREQWQACQQGHGLADPVVDSGTPRRQVEPHEAILSEARGFPRGVRLSPESALYYTRMRRRARWVRALENILGGRRGTLRQVLVGRWVSQLPHGAGRSYQTYLQAGIEGGVRILGGGFQTWGEDGQPKADSVYYIVDTGEGVEAVFPALLGRLRQYALGRQRNGELFGALRTRAQSWCSGAGLDACTSDIAIASAVSLAMVPSPHEQQACARVHRAIKKASSLCPPLLT